MSKAKDALKKIFRERGFDDFKWIDPKQVIIAQWVRMKCTYGCPNYGEAASCPPNVPSVSDCREFFDEYDLAAIFHFSRSFDNPDDRHDWTRETSIQLLEVEKEVFLSGYVKTFLMFMDACELCEECTAIRADCKHPKRARPTPEAMGVDVFSTVRQIGYPIDVLKDYSDTMNRYAILLVE
ncbi:MAG: DUF2284 domain-containing protein [Candidatus Thorarchaeota archaeon]|nr:MAG: DUF2284 domain-containing protein [Candidatus Thorarchaeota archaeon]